MLMSHPAAKAYADRMARLRLVSFSKTAKPEPIDQCTPCTEAKPTHPTVGVPIESLPLLTVQQPHLARPRRREGEGNVCNLALVRPRSSDLSS